MKTSQRFPVVLVLSLFAVACESKNKAMEAKDDPRLSAIRLPPGFKIGLFATDVENAHSLALGER
jgi:hypothetical protein